MTNFNTTVKISNHRAGVDLTNPDNIAKAVKFDINNNIVIAGLNDKPIGTLANLPKIGEATEINTFGRSALAKIIGTVNDGDLLKVVNDGKLGITSDGDTLPATDQWVDASPSAINGGDYVYRFGDQVENYLVVNGFFRADHYDLNHLNDIRDRV